MITTICGEDTATSRRFFVQLKTQYTQKGYEIKDITPQDVYELPKWLGESVSLFASRQVFFVERMESVIIRRRGRKPAKEDPNSPESILNRLSNSKTIEIVDWEEKSGRELKLKDIALVKEFKPSQTIFKLIDSFVPGNKHGFIGELQLLAKDQDDIFVFIMLYRHIRALILATSDTFPKTVQPWQRGKLKSQAAMFTQNRLTDIYQALYRLEIATKTGTNPTGLRKSLEILACYYL